MSFCKSILIRFKPKVATASFPQGWRGYFWFNDQLYSMHSRGLTFIGKYGDAALSKSNFVYYFNKLLIESKPESFTRFRIDDDSQAFYIKEYNKIDFFKND